jgi:uncharacterized protein (TIGR03067 family)
MHASRLALCGLLLSAAASFAEDEVEPPANSKVELRKMEGTYHVTLFERDGRQLGAADLKLMKVVMSKDGGGKFHQGNAAYGSQVTVYPNKKPKEVDCVYTDGPLKGAMIKGIYKIDKDGFSCCYAESGKPRPTEFKTALNSGLTLYVLQRVKEK